MFSSSMTDDLDEELLQVDLNLSHVTPTASSSSEHGGNWAGNKDQHVGEWSGNDEHVGECSGNDEHVGEWSDNDGGEDDLLLSAALQLETIHDPQETQHRDPQVSHKSHSLTFSNSDKFSFVKPADMKMQISKTLKTDFLAPNSPPLAANSSDVLNRQVLSHSHSNSFDWNQMHKLKKQNFHEKHSFESPTVEKSNMSQDTVKSSKWSTSKRKRKFPGPAGVLPKLNANVSLDSLENFKPASPACKQKIPANTPLPSSQSSEDKFQDELWLKMKRELDRKADKLLQDFCLSKLPLKARCGQLPCAKVPVVCAIVEQLFPSSNDASAILRDPSGSMRATIHRNLMKDLATEFQAGNVLVLRQCGVFSPTNRSHYLNITPSNLVKIYTRSNDGAAVCKHIGRFHAGDLDNFQMTTRVRRTVLGAVEKSRLLQSCEKSPVNITSPKSSESLFEQTRIVSNFGGKHQQEQPAVVVTNNKQFVAYEEKRLEETGQEKTHRKSSFKPTCSSLTSESSSCSDVSTRRFSFKAPFKSVQVPAAEQVKNAKVKDTSGFSQEDDDDDLEDLLSEIPDDAFNI